jgi:cyclopropane-fatty-acyl-phospholipid synthase
MKSRLYQAHLSHERHHPVGHRFQYRLPIFVFDLNELETGCLDGSLFGRRTAPGSSARAGSSGPRLLSLRESDYLYAGRGGLREKLGRALTSGGLDPGLSLGCVRLVTSARFLGSIFNPVSFWFVFTHEGAEGVAALVAEVNNTFGEKHIYVLGDGTQTAFPARFTARKAFHVSPFNDMDGEYAFCLADVRSGLDLSVDLFKDGQPLLQAHLWAEGAGLPLTGRALAGFLLRPQRMLTYPRILRQAASLFYRRRLRLHPKPSPSSPMTIRRAPSPRLGLMERPARAILHRLLSRTRTGRLRLVEPDGRKALYQGHDPGPIAELAIHDPRFYKALALSGDIGFGEAYTAGWWNTPDLPELLRFFVLNREEMRLAEILNIPGPAISFFNRLRRLGGSRNTRAGARANIEAHYDLGDELFKTFLDPSLTYSCAYFEDGSADLARAQEAKYRLIARKLDLRPEDRVLEIGFGWGGFALYAAQRFSCRVDGITISRNQQAYAQQKAQELGLDHLVSFRLLDYRDLEATYDKIVSIEMLEAVGHAYHRDFFSALERLLAPEGAVCIQFIAIHDQRYEAYRLEGDWTRKHIFPGGLLPSLTRVMEVVRDSTGFTLRSLESLAPHYAQTLALWRSSFRSNEARVAELGYDEAFRRKWNYYLAYCQAGFSCRVIDDYQIVLARPAGMQPRR